MAHNQNGVQQAEEMTELGGKKRKEKAAGMSGSSAVSVWFLE